MHVLTFGCSSASHHAVVSPGPPRADVEFLDAARRGFGVVENLRIENDAEFPEELVEGIVPVGQARKLHGVLIDIRNDGLLRIDHDLPQGLESTDFAPEELNQFPGVFDRTRIDNHWTQSLT